MRKQARLILEPDGPEQHIVTFYDQIVVGRRPGRESPKRRRVVVHNCSVSGRHCVIRQEPDGRFFIRDVSRNGTRLDGERLVPNVLTELSNGQRIDLPGGSALLFQVDPTEVLYELIRESLDGDAPEDIPTVEASVLVGVVSSYGQLTRMTDEHIVSSAVGRSLDPLAVIIRAHSGTLWKCDAHGLLAYWEQSPRRPGWHTDRACAAALAVRERVFRMARTPAAWPLCEPGFTMEWALATGPLVIATVGEDFPSGLVIYGETLNQAYRLPRLANAGPDPLVTDLATFERTRARFEFDELGERPGLDGEGTASIYALRGRR